MLSALLTLPLLLLIVVSIRPAKKCGALLIGLLACTAVASAQQLPGAEDAFLSADGPDLVVLGGTAQQVIALNDFAPELKDGTCMPPLVTGTFITRSFVLANIGASGPLNVAAITLTGRSSGFFSVEAVLVEGKPQTLPLTLAPGQQANISIRYEAATIGKHTAMLTIHNNDEDEGLFAFMVQASTIPDMTQPDEPAPLLNGIASATSPHMP